MLWYSHGQGISQTRNEQGTAVAVPTNIDQVSTTTVSTDWQKQFFGTTTSSIKLLAKEDTSAAEMPLTFTDQLGRDYFTQYMMAKQAGLEGDTDVVNGINNRFINRIADVANPTVYFMKNLSVLPDSGKNQIIDYGKNLMAVLKDMPTGDAATIANDAFNQGDMSILKEIDPIIIKCESIVTALQEISVPQSMAQYHLDLLNGIGITLYNAESLRNAERDPARGLAAISIYVTGLQNISTALSNMQNSFLSVGISFQNKN